MPDDAPDDPERIIADLRRDRDEALAREAAITEVLGVINSSPGDLAPVFDAILEKTHSLGRAALGSLMTVENSHFRAIAARGVPECFAAVLQAGFDGAPDNPIVMGLAGGAPYLHVPDMAEIAAHAPPDDPIPRMGVEVGRVRTLLIVPLCKDGAVVAIIAAYRQEVRPFTDKQIALLQKFAAQGIRPTAAAASISFTVATAHTGCRIPSVSIAFNASVSDRPR